MKIKVIRCPLCCMELPVDIFLQHMASDHDIEAKSLKELNERIKNCGFDDLEFIEEEYQSFEDMNFYQPGEP